MREVQRPGEYEIENFWCALVLTQLRKSVKPMCHTSESLSGATLRKPVKDWNDLHMDWEEIWMQLVKGLELANISCTNSLQVSSSLPEYDMAHVFSEQMKSKIKLQFKMSSLTSGHFSMWPARS